ncbi:hypothetical protein VTH82DRAFT_2485 [Thermothelomyces myriococcoides]
MTLLVMCRDNNSSEASGPAYQMEVA